MRKKEKKKIDRLKNLKRENCEKRDGEANERKENRTLIHGQDRLVRPPGKACPFVCLSVCPRGDSNTRTYIRASESTTANMLLFVQ